MFVINELFVFQNFERHNITRSNNPGIKYDVIHKAGLSFKPFAFINKLQEFGGIAITINVVRITSNCKDDMSTYKRGKEVVSCGYRFTRPTGFNIVQATSVKNILPTILFRLVEGKAW